MNGEMQGLPEGWTRAVFGNVSEYISRGKSPKYSDQSSLPVVNQKAIRWSGIVDEHLKFIHPDQFDQWAAERFIQEGDILWNSTGTGTIGRACLVASRDVVRPKVVDSHVTIVRAFRNEIEPRYLFGWIRGHQVQSQIEALATGTTNQIELNRSMVVETELPLAPLAEQKVIADKLDALLAQVDTLKARLDAIPAILKRFRQSVLSAAVTGKLTEEWRSRRNEHDIKWINASIGDIAEVKGGKRLPSGEAVLDEKTPYPYIRVSDFSGLTIDSNNLKYLSKEAQKAIQRYTISSNDVFISIAGTIGSVGMVPSWLDGANLTENAAKIVIDKSRADTKYVMYHLAGPSAQAEIAGSVVSNTQPKLALFRIQKLAIPLPPLLEQTEIVCRVESLFAYAEQIEARTQEAAARVKYLTQSVLAKAFRGELTEEWRMSHPDLVSGQNSAEALLERIRTARAAVPKAKGKQVGPLRDKNVFISNYSELFLDHIRVRESRMSKSRTDEDVNGKAYLAGCIALLGGQAKIEALFQASDLALPDFYKQLDWELSQALIKERNKIFEAV